MRLLTAILLLLLIPCITSARRINTLRKLPKAQRTEIASASAGANADTVTSPDAARVRFYGYEKTLRATKETLFIGNNTDSLLSSITFSIRYLDAQHRQIHSRRITLSPSIPPQEIRRVDFPSWDTQKTYYFIDGPAPRKSATPYRVAIQADTIIYTRP